MIRSSRPSATPNSTRARSISARQWLTGVPFSRGPIRRFRARIGGLAFTAVGLCALAACGSGTAADATQTRSPGPVIASPLPSASTTSAAPDGSVSPTPADRAPAGPTVGSRPPGASSTPVAGPSSSECDRDLLQSSVAALAPDLATGVQQVQVYNCAAGFARLYATPNPTSDGGQPDGDQFFLRFSRGQWQLLMRGSGVDCGDNEPRLAEACAVFDRS